MSAQLKEILLKGNEAISAGNNEAFLELCTEDTVWEFIGDRVLRGKQAVRDYMKENYVEPPRFHVTDLVAEGNKLVAMGEISLKDSSGQWVDYAYCDVWHFEGDKFAALKAYVVSKG